LNKKVSRIVEYRNAIAEIKIFIDKSLAGAGF
jgi:hypothetical protein